MTTASDLIQAGYARSTANDPGKLATDLELLGRLNRSYQGLYALAARQRPDSFTTVALVTLDALASFVLPTDYIDVLPITNAAGKRVHLIPARETMRLYHVAPCLYQKGNTIVSRGNAGDPVTGDVLTVPQLASAAPLVALSTAVDAKFPTRHHECLVNDLALYLDAKDEDRDPDQFKKLAADQGAKMAAFAAEYDLDASALEFMHNAAERVASAEGGA